MDIAEWWPRLDEASRGWLVEHNGEAIPPAVGAAISAAGGLTGSAASAGQSSPTGLFLPDAAVDWIEERANGE